MGDTPDVFLGMLRSEYDAPDELPETFIGLANLTNQVIDRWMQHTLDAHTALTLLTHTILVSADGTQWTVGARSGRWYRRLPSGSWHIAAPPSNATYDPNWGTSLSAATATVSEVLARP